MTGVVDSRQLHLFDDLDQAGESHHHSLGRLPTQASPGSHIHNGKDSNALALSSTTGLVAALLGKAASVHLHTETDVTSLVTDLGHKLDNSLQGGSSAGVSGLTGATYNSTTVRPLDTVVTKVQSATISLNFPASGTQASGTISFPTPFTSIAPIIAANAVQNFDCTLNIYTITLAGFSWRVRRLDAAPASIYNFFIHYIALGS